MAVVSLDLQRVRAIAAALDNSVRLDMLRVLLDKHVAYPGELSSALTVSPQQMTKHVAILQRGGLVKTSAEGRRVRIELAGPGVRALLRTMSGTRETTRCTRRPSRDGASL